MDNHLLSETDEAIIRAVHTYRYMRQDDISLLIRNDRVNSRLRARLSRLCGGADKVPGKTLYRLPLPTFTPGNPARVYTLGIVGRDYLRKIGIDADWYYRPDRSGIAGYQFLTHNLHLTRVLVAAAKWSREQTAYALKETRTCYEFGARVLAGAIAAIPDAWLLFQRLPEGTRFPFLFELDMGTEYQTKFKEHVKYRIFFIQSGRYTETFGTKAVVVVYLAVGPNATDRRQTMCRWTEELLRELAMGEWGEIFKFGGVSETELYSGKLFTETMWQVPYQKPLVSLFD